MAESLALPCSGDPESAVRLSEVLTAMIEDGGDPGPRGVQICSLGLSIETLLQALRSELSRLGIAKKLDELMNGLTQFTTLARAYQAD